VIKRREKRDDATKDDAVFERASARAKKNLYSAMMKFLFDDS
jgi:hypothetical protein